MEAEKPLHTVVLDAGPIIKNEPPISTLLAKCHKIITAPAIINEIRDIATRARLQTTLLPFLELREPSPSSIKIISDFARRTGDLQVLSRPDIQLLALTYEVECEKNGGDWRLRSVPGQKKLNGLSPTTLTETPETAATDAQLMDEQSVETASSAAVVEATGPKETHEETAEQQWQADLTENIVNDMHNSHISLSAPTPTLPQTIMHPNSQSDVHLETQTNEPPDMSAPPNLDHDSDSDSDGWITPANLHSHQHPSDSASHSPSAPAPRTLQAACLTSDFAMQNVLLQMNLNLISPSLTRVRHIKTFVLRCHACFLVVRDTSKQFCPRCGKPALTRVACSTDEQGRFALHLKRNMQWNTRGDRYAVPKPVAGTANGKVKAGQGGGKGGWGQGLILAEDQKEYVRAVGEQRRVKARDLMDEDYLPAILTGERRSVGAKIVVGAGRNVNSRKR